MNAKDVLETEGTARELASLIPRCPECGSPLVLAMDEMRLARPDGACKASAERLRELAQMHKEDGILVMELGVGRRNDVIKRTLQDIALESPESTYVIFNYSEIDVPTGLENRTLAFPGDVAEAMGAVRDE